MKDFFISYSKADRDLAVWVNQQLRDAGYTTTIQSADMPPGSAFVHEMDKAVEENQGLVAVLSPDYLKSPHCKSEWQAFYQKDPNGEKRALIPVRVRECQPKGLLAQRVYIDLVGKDGLNHKTHRLKAELQTLVSPSSSNSNNSQPLTFNKRKVSSKTCSSTRPSPPRSNQAKLNATRSKIVSKNCCANAASPSSSTASTKLAARVSSKTCRQQSRTSSIRLMAPTLSSSRLARSRCGNSAMPR